VDNLLARTITGAYAAGTSDYCEAVFWHELPDMKARLSGLNFLSRKSAASALVGLSQRLGSKSAFKWSPDARRVTITSAFDPCRTYGSAVPLLGDEPCFDP